MSFIAYNEAQRIKHELEKAGINVKDVGAVYDSPEEKAPELIKKMFPERVEIEFEPDTLHVYNAPFPDTLSVLFQLPYKSIWIELTEAGSVVIDPQKRVYVFYDATDVDDKIDRVMKRLGYDKVDEKEVDVLRLSEGFVKKITA